MRITDGINFKKNSDSCDKYAEWLFKMPEMVVKKKDDMLLLFEWVL